MKVSPKRSAVKTVVHLSSPYSLELLQLGSVGMLIGARTTHMINDLKCQASPY